MSPLLYALFGAMLWTSGLLAGLFWGERRRREDAQIREGAVPVERRTKPAPTSRRVTPEDTMTPEELEAELERKEVAFNVLVEDGMAAGLSRKDAKRDAENMVAELERLGVKL